MASPPIARGRDPAVPMPAVAAISNRRTSVCAQRAGNVAPKSAAVARAADTRCQTGHKAEDVPLWIRTDEQEEAVAALEAFAHFLPLVATDLFGWRWAIVSLHTALQGFMVVAIRDSAGLSPLPDDLAAAWLQAHRSGLSTP